MLVRLTCHLGKFQKSIASRVNLKMSLGFAQIQIFSLLFLEPKNQNQCTEHMGEVVIT